MDRRIASSPGLTAPYESEGDNLVVRRIAILIVSCGLILGLGMMQIHPTFGQDPAKKDAPQAKPEASKEPAKDEASKAGTQKTAEPAKDKAAEPAKDKEKKEEAPKVTEAPLPPIPKEVQDKIDAARRAVAEAIVAAQDAGLVETSIDPPPILDILVTGRATDARTLKNASAKKPYAVTPEVFAAWFTGYGAQGFESVDYVKDVRIVNPSGGLKAFFDQRAVILRNEIAEVRKAKGQPATSKPAETKSAEKKDDATPADNKKAGEPKK
jgi:hypothetical protein